MTLAWETHEKDVFGIGLGPSYRLLKAALQWRKDGTGMIATPIAETGAFLKTDPELDRPDIQLHFIIGVVDDHGRKLHWGNGFSVHTCVLRPKSVGNVGLRSSNPLEAPMIDPNFLSEDEDNHIALAGFLKFNEKLLEVKQRVAAGMSEFQICAIMNIIFEERAMLDEEAVLGTRTRKAIEECGRWLMGGKFEGTPVKSIMRKVTKHLHYVRATRLRRGQRIRKRKAIFDI